DGVDVVAHHPDEISGRRPRLAQRVGVELAADHNVMAPAGCSVDHSLQGAPGQAGLDKDGLDASLHEEGDEVLNIPQPDLAIGADALETHDFDAVGTAKVAKGIVSRDQDPLGGWDLRDTLAYVTIEAIELLHVSGSVLLVGLLVDRIHLDQPVADPFDGQLPQGKIKPNMGIVMPVKWGSLDQEFLRDVLAHGHRR